MDGWSRAGHLGEKTLHEISLCVNLLAYCQCNFYDLKVGGDSVLLSPAYLFAANHIAGM